MSEPQSSEFLGKAYELRLPPALLDADGEPAKIQFTFQSYIGSPVMDLSGQVKYPHLEDLKPGMEILAYGLTGYYRTVVREINDNTGFAESQNHWTMLEYGRDDRGLWISCGMIAKRALERLKI